MSMSLFEVYGHLVFSTHNRQNYFIDDEIRKSVHAYLATLIRDKGSKFVVVGGATDHIHILFKLPKTLSPTDLIAIIKRESSKFIKRLGKEYELFSWQRGYGLFSVGPLNVGRVEQYVRNQMEHHQKMSFQDEVRSFLDKYKVEYDEKYLWD